MAARSLLHAAVFLLLVLIWGTTWAAIRIGLEGIPPFTGVALRFAIAGALLLALVPLLGVRLGREPRERWLWAANGLLSFSASYGIVYWAEQWIPSGLAAVLFAVYPFFVAVLAHYLVPGDRMSVGSIAGTALGFLGVVVIFSEDLTRLGGERVALAAVVMLGAPFVSAVASVAVKRWGGGLHPLSLTAVPMLLTAGVMGALAAATERHREIVFDAVSVGALLYLAIAGSAVTFTLYFWLLNRIKVSNLSLIAFLIPVVAVAVGYFVLAEPLTGRVLAGSGLVVAGVGLALLARPPAPPPAVEATAAAAGSDGEAA